MYRADNRPGKARGQNVPFPSAPWWCFGRKPVLMAAKPHERELQLQERVAAAGGAAFMYASLGNRSFAVNLCAQTCFGGPAYLAASFCGYFFREWLFTRYARGERYLPVAYSARLRALIPSSNCILRTEGGRANAVPPYLSIP